MDILVNNAGIILREDAVSVPLADWLKVIQINETAVFQLSQLAGRDMMKRNAPGKIINIASLLSFQGGIRVPSYAAAKGAVAQITKALANEWAVKGIQVNAIAPGYIATNNTAQLRADPERAARLSSTASQRGDGGRLPTLPELPSSSPPLQPTTSPDTFWL